MKETDDPLYFFRKQLSGHTIMELIALHAAATDKGLREAIDDEMKRRHGEKEGEAG